MNAILRRLDEEPCVGKSFVRFCEGPDRQLPVLLYKAKFLLPILVFVIVFINCQSQTGTCCPTEYSDYVLFEKKDNTKTVYGADVIKNPKLIQVHVFTLHNIDTGYSFNRPVSDSLRDYYNLIDSICSRQAGLTGLFELDTSANVWVKISAVYNNHDTIEIKNDTLRARLILLDSIMWHG